MRRSKTARLCALVLLFVGCNAILGNEDSYSLVPPQKCLLPSQCPTGQVCLFETCSPPCFEDIDCPNPAARCLRLENGAAACVVSTDATCSSGVPCPRGAVCKDGACRNECSGSGCLKNQRCVSGVCVGTDPKRDPLAGTAEGGAGGAGGGANAGAGAISSESAGEAGAALSGGRGPASGGAPNSGGRVGGGGTNNGGESAGSSNEAGSGGAPEPCVPTGAEQCFNNEDDDCNGNVDCADSACATPAMCAPQPARSTLGTFPMTGSSCPTGYTAVTLRRGLDASYECAGCSCTPESSYCHSGIYGHGANACPGPYTGVLSNVYSTSCGGVPADANLYYFAVTGFTTCTASGSPTLAPATWSETRTFCQPMQVGGGCAAGSQCIPRLSSGLCARVPGATSCTSDYSTSTGETWFTGVADTRECLPCSCGFGSANCAGAYIQVWGSGNCTGETAVIGNGAQGETCGLPFVPQTARIVGNPSAPSCQPNNFATGEAVGENPQTVCCR